MDPLALLEKHNPVLVIFPDDLSRQRPGSLFESGEGRGDYHPCPAEFFLSLVTWRPRPKPWLEDLAFWTPGPRLIGIERLKKKALGADRAETLQWELDLKAIRSQEGGQAWRAYGEVRKSAGDAAAPVVYGRYVDGPKPALHYWYLYAYNDAVNDHEGDWESVAIELDSDGVPVGAGYSGHEGGFRREWDRVLKDGDRPLVYVARGSHAAYFEHLADGHRTNSLSYPKNLPPLADAALSAALDLFGKIRALRDHTPAHPDDASEPALRRGVLLQPEVRMFPAGESGQTPDFWWMGLCGRWGSSHVRLRGTIAPAPPWEKGEKWRDPASWIERCTPD